MSPSAALHWLAHDVFPLWLEQSLDRELGGFRENLSMNGTPLPGPRRSMVQARQIYSMRIGMELGVCDLVEGKAALASAVEFVLKHYSLPSGGIRHSVTESGEPLEETPDLYGQAFALFGMAHAYAVLEDPTLKTRALHLLEYLRRERKAPGGGFTELDGGHVVFRSNPHMHLFEAAIAWMEVDKDPAWERLASEILDLCLGHFIDPSTGALGEYFHSGWSRELEQGRFVYEPGHLCEWSWLMGRFSLVSSRDLMKFRVSLFELSEKTGLNPQGALIDQLWSDYAPKLKSARFWPQCERIKAASQLGREKAARDGMSVLSRYFETEVRGLWFDTLEESGSFRAQPAKSSSLYHIIGAISEFQRFS